MKIIIHGVTGDPGQSLILASRAAQAAIDSHLAEGGSTLIDYEDGSQFYVKRNKLSFSVWPQTW